MTKQFCDKCGKDITGKKSASLHLIPDADEHGDGTVTETVDLCPKCLIKFKGWVGIRV